MEKKHVTIIVIIVGLVVGFLRFGWPDPIKDDLKALSNANLSANDKAINAEIKNWATYTQPIQYQRGVNNIIIPKIDESVDMLNNTQLTTPEVIALKQIHVEALELYRKGAEVAVEGINKNDEKKIETAIKYFEAGDAKVDEYNSNLRILAKDHGMRVIEE
ncbi:MAG: hypothetical protein J6C01_11035 [Lachnospiraceae bacterium]|nr:hypothetical protein [Lachnospiraceae bacterium]